MFISVLTQVLILLILILVGVILSKAGVITKEGASVMTDVVLLIVTPCVIIKSFIRELNPETLRGLAISVIIAVLAHIGFILMSLLLRDKDKGRQRVLQFGTIFSNCGFMAIPLQQALLGDEGVFYGSSFVAVFNLFIWSYGITLMSGDKKRLSPKKLLLNPGVIGLAVGLIIFLTQIPVPDIGYQAVSHFAALNTPVPMLIIGYHLYNSNILRCLKDVKAIIGILLRLLVFPFIALGVMYLCGVRGVMLVSNTICCSAPIAAITTMFSAKFGADTELSVATVSLSTILSLITMPVVITVAQLIA